MVSSPITSWEIDGETVETVTLFWGAPKSLQMVTAAMKSRCLLLGRKAMTSLDSILKSRDVTFPTNVLIVKAMVFPVVMHGCERRLSTEELMISKCGAGEDLWESLRVQTHQTSQS